jgi:hypothetical protein
MPTTANFRRLDQQPPAATAVNRWRRRWLRRKLPTSSTGELPADAAGCDARIPRAAVQRVPFRASPAAAQPGPAVVSVVLPARQPDHGVDVGGGVRQQELVVDHGRGASLSAVAAAFSSVVDRESRAVGWLVN